MKRCIILWLFSVCIMGCLYAGDTLMLDLSGCLDGYPLNEEGVWEETYTDESHIECGIFLFSHSGSGDAGGGMAYWDGFTLSVNGDSTNYGAEGSSDGWISKQFGCMAGGGLNAEGQVEQGKPYLVAYWGFNFEKMQEDYHSVRVDFTDGEMHKAVGVYVCNHPWPYYGNINGDGFAGGFSQEGDYFKLIAHGLDDNGKPTGTSVEYNLAQFTNGQLVQSNQWEYMDLTLLGNVAGIYFTMSTSDEDSQFGANTAVYFCLDRLTVTSIDGEETDTMAMQAVQNLTVVDITDTTATLRWTSEPKAVHYKIYVDGVFWDQAMSNTHQINYLSPNTTYQVEVEAEDKDGNLAERSQVMVTTTGSHAPAEAGIVSITALTDTTVSLRWNTVMNASRYNIYVDSVFQAQTTDTTYQIQGLQPNTAYRIEVEAEYSNGTKAARQGLSIRTTGISLPATVENLRLVKITDTTARVKWNAAIAASRYNIYVDGAYIGKTTDTTYEIGGLTANTTYMIEVEAVNAAGIASPKRRITITTEPTPAITSLNEEYNEETWVEYYTIYGQKIGSQRPKTAGIYIKRSANMKQISKKIIITY